MRRGILMLGMLCSVLSLAAPLQVHAADPAGERILIRCEVPVGGEFAPGDTMERSFRILNPHAEAVQVRVGGVENLRGSDLFSVVQARWSGEERAHALSDSSGLNRWLEIGANEEKVLRVSLHFPEEAGNEYQGTELLARLCLECRYAEEGAVSDGKPSVEIDGTAAAEDREQGLISVRTGDVSNWRTPLVMTVGSGGCILFLLRKRREKPWREYEK